MNICIKLSKINVYLKASFFCFIYTFYSTTLHASVDEGMSTPPALLYYMQSRTINAEAYLIEEYEPGGQYYEGSQKISKSKNSSNLILSKSAITSSATESDSGPVSEDILSRLKIDESITPETTELLGERISLTTGNVSFHQIDVNLPGNSSLEVAVRRVFRGADYIVTNKQEFGDWQLDIPHIHTTLLRNTSRYSGDWGQGRECSGDLNPGEISDNGSTFMNYEYWNGDTLNIPGSINEKLLVPSSGGIASIGDGYRRITQSNWRISCIDRKNSNDEVIGEGFVAHSPDGKTYTFDELRLVVSKPLVKDFKATPRYQAYMMVSKIEDRFGNWVKYHYDDSSKITSISANDGRQITFGYGTVDNKYNISTVTVNGRVWNYDYINHQSSVELSLVTLPDNRQWLYDLSRIGVETPLSKYNDRCGFQDPRSGTTVGTITHPNGLKGTFTLRETLHGRTMVRNMVNPFTLVHTIPKCFATMSIVNKSLTGPGLETLSWNYTYSENRGLFDDEIATSATRLSGDLPSNINDVDYKTTSVEAPDGSKTVYYYNRDMTSAFENQLFAQDQYDTDGVTRRSQVLKNYQNGVSLGSSELMLENLYSDRYRSNLSQQQIINYFSNGSDTYTIDYLDYDVYGISSKRHEYNSFNAQSLWQHNEHTTASVDFINADSKGYWLINLPKTVQVSAVDSSYTTVNEITYHSDLKGNSIYKNLHLPYENLQFGTWKTRYASYHADGNVNRIEINQRLKTASGTDVACEDETGEAIPCLRYKVLSNYKRGQPRSIAVPSRYAGSGTLTASRTVDDNGWVTGTTDLNGNSNGYGYDSIGRLVYVDSPSGWLDTYFDWTQATGEAPVRTAKRCTLNAAKTGCSGTATLHSTLTFDALMRPVLTTNTDVANNINRYQNKAFNAWNKETFSSYWSTSSTETAGTTNVYDGLQRLVTTSQDGGGTQTTSYLAGNQIKVTDPEQNDTTTTYLAYGSPSYEQALSIESPEGVTTSQNINLFGDLTTITQSAPSTVAQTEYRAYDSQHHLCKISRNDVGTTVFNNNALGEVQWQAQGVTSTSNTNCDATVADTQKVELYYDNLGDTWKVDYAHAATPDLSYARDSNGNLKTLTAGTVTQTYNYNSLNLLEDENLSVSGKSFTLDYHYNTAGVRDWLLYPDGDKVEFAPNGFGEPTQAVRQARTGRTLLSYASNATYYPTGSINTFNYGNGLSHNTTLNSRKVPDSIKDSKTGLTALHYSYTYDNNLNVKSVFNNDDKDDPYSLTNLTYDGLDRLRTTTGNSGIGNSSITYDGLGNIQTYNSKGHTLEYTYNYTQDLTKYSDGFSNQLRQVADGIGTKDYVMFDYDDRGNITNNSYHAFTYNRANQLTASGTNSYTYDGHNRRVKQTDSKGTSYSLYSQDGTLYYRETPTGGINYIYLGKKLIAKDGVIPENAGKQHFRPYGESIEGEIDDAGYTGHKFDTDLGLSYMQARYYDPVIGRFYSNDPVDTMGHIARGNPVHGFNRYAYANNNPYKYVDPNGEAGVIGFLAGVGLEITRQALTGELSDTSLSGIAKNAGKALVSGFAGAAGVGLATKASQLGNVLRVSANTAGGAAIGATSTVANNAIDGNKLTDNLGVGTGLGALGGAAGTIVGDAIEGGTAALKQKAFNSTSVADQNLTQHIKGATGGGASSTSVGVGDAIGNVASNAAGVADSCGVKNQC